MTPGNFTRGPAGEMCFRSYAGALYLLGSGDEIRVLHSSGALIYSGHLWMDDGAPLDIPAEHLARWCDQQYRGEYLTYRGEYLTS